MKTTKVLIVASLLAAVGVGAFYLGRGTAGPSESDAAASVKYHCPMHPTYVSNRPGACPICGMDLVKVKLEDGDGPAGTHTGHATASAAPGLPGRVPVFISPDRRQQIGLTTARVERRVLSHIVRAPAVVTHDETRYARIAPRFSGWVRRLHVNFTGAPVEKGQPLLTVYSPELFSAENEYLIAWRGLRQLKADASDDQHHSAANLLNAARRRLDLWEVGDEEIRALEQRGTPGDELLFRASFAGHVVAKSAVEGRAFTAGESLFEVADLSHLWLEAWIVESDMPLMKPGLQAAITFPFLASKTLTAPVTFVYPHLDPQARRGRVRMELDNPGHLLRPDMWADVEIQTDSAEVLAAPASAVIDTGGRYVAFVSKGDGHLEPRELKVGRRNDDYYEVLDSLKEGEQVVTRALFLVDSESQLKAAIAGMGASQAGEPVSSVLAHYVKIQTALAADSLDGVREAAENISKLMPDPVRAQAAAVATAQDIATARELFKLLSASVLQIVEREHIQTGRYFEAHCDMAKAGWLQIGRELRNPYFGKSMLDCGEIKKAR